MRNYILSCLLISITLSCSPPPKLIKLSGPVFGTGYNIRYYDKDNTNYQVQFDSLFKVINQSMSTYIPDSDISRINRNETITVDNHFKTVFKASQLIYEETNGAFDPTIGSVVNAWDFGPEGKIEQLDSLKIKSLMTTVGFNKVMLQDDQIIKPAAAYLDFNAIAKGYGIDVIADFLESKGINNYLVDIGGDLRVEGMNVETENGWKIGIDDPNFDGVQSYSKIIELASEAMATSGTYRKFKVDDNGNRYAHIINTTTGYPSQTNVLSVSVIAPNCTLADGYATAFQAMGIDAVKTFLNDHPELKVYFIYEDELELKTLGLNGFPEN
ncbi:MAG: FAD:protein FMN transferase [Winogradskyella sp.]|nr:FAD:protein FMN transferase [Winogradskyella sp.]MBT8376795.1 FAD:protein FMN transferase [Bacteroidia bacterium]NNC45674.1 FAD:protein FMN transferase [Winogradskyella sp.]NNF86030.1 FAD:protein FMN transferase [Winogradskyella sp.]NNL83691.1 FAD:protein FMN transferase [Winogradskyella sp.]